MIQIVIEDRDIRKSIPENLKQLLKHILNCIYQPKLYHGSWSESIKKQSNQLQKEINRHGYKKVYRIVSSTLESAYEESKKLFFIELHNSIQSGKGNPYTEQEMQSVIPKTISNLGKDTMYSNFVWTEDTLLNSDNISKFLQKVSEQHSNNIR